jgi:CRISPR/Cas system-associated exonuclease Cas4 (RecB family)
MSDFDDLLAQIGHVEELKEASKKIHESTLPDDAKGILFKSDLDLFTVEQFVENVWRNSIFLNKVRHDAANRISGYDISSGCIREVFFRFNNYPVQKYADSWLPISLRGIIGNAVHDFIQRNYNFTETERSMKVPSINFSGRFDGMIGNNILCEIKSCTYKDYKTIISKQSARTSDFYQCFCYKYILENHLDEIKSQPRETLRTDPPSADKYNIDKFQLIYVAQNVVNSDASSISECEKEVTALNKMLKTAKNPFAFIHVLTYDLTKLNTEVYETYVKEKIEAIMEFINNNKVPPKDHKFVLTSLCFFCKYKDHCSSTP